MATVQPRLDSFRIERIIHTLNRMPLFRIDWSQPLSAGLRSISQMGALILATHTSSPRMTIPTGHGQAQITFDTLLPNVLKISSDGVAAFRLVMDKMSLLEQTAMNIDDSLEDIINKLGRVRHPIPSTLSGALLRFSEATERCRTYAEEAKTAFFTWDNELEQLKSAILQTHNALPASLPPRDLPSALLPPPRAPVFSTADLPATHNNVPPIALLYQLDGTDQFWRDLPAIEACIRRVHQALTSSSDGTVDWPLFLSPEGQQYSKALYDKLCRFNEVGHLADWGDGWEVRRMKRGISYCSVTMSYLAPEYCHSPRRREHVDKDGATWLPFVRAWWAYYNLMAPVAAHHLGMTTPVHLWDPQDMMDRLYCGLPPIQPPVTPSPPTIPVNLAPTGRPAGNTSQSHPASFSEALVAARTEINTLYTFFRESASLTHSLVTVQVHEFMSTANSLLAQPTVSDIDRRDLIKAAQALKAYFSIVEAVSRMYTDVHLSFMQSSVVSLIAVSSSRAGPDLEARLLALAAETASKEASLAAYIAPRKEEMLAQIRANS